MNNFCQNKVEIRKLPYLDVTDVERSVLIFTNVLQRSKLTADWMISLSGDRLHDIEASDWISIPKPFFWCENLPVMGTVLQELRSLSLRILLSTKA